MSIGSLGDATPPPAITLIWSAPPFSSSRAARRTASGPSATWAKPVVSMPHAHRRGWLLGAAVSPWPPVCDSTRPERKIRGAAISPASAASFSPRSSPPASRIVVKPRRSIPSRIALASMPIRVSGRWFIEPMSIFVIAAWTWASMSPGISVRPPASRRGTSSPDARRCPSTPTSTMRSPSTRTLAPSTQLAGGQVQQHGSLDHETRHSALQVCSSATGRRRYRSAFVELIPAAS